MQRMSLFNIFLTLVDPFKIGRNYVVSPVWNLLTKIYEDTLDKTKTGVLSVRDIVVRIIILLIAIILILWTAAFMYVAFYYAYMPSIAHTRPVHMQFKSCDAQETIWKLNENSVKNSICSFPSAHVPLTRKQQLLMVGQPYRVLITIDMPESPENEKAGMFMVCAEMRDNTGKLRGHSCRSTMLHYKSILHRWISTWLKTPLYLLGFSEEKQEVVVELFSSYQDDDHNSVTDVYVELQSKQVQFYSVSLHITAHFTGLRYFMFHWPLLSATIGIFTNLFFIIIICLMSWYHWSENNDWIDEAKEKICDLTKRKFLHRRKSSIEDKISEEDSNQLEDDDISVIEEFGSDKSGDSEGPRHRKLLEKY